MTVQTGSQPTASQQTTSKDAKLYQASQWQLIWWRFCKHRVAVISGVIIVFLYVVAAFAEFIAPYDPAAFSPLHAFVPPQQIRVVDSEGTLRPPFVYGLTRSRDPETARITYEPDTSVIMPLKFFVRGDEYKFWGLIRGDLHLFGIDAGPRDRVFIWGADRLGRDLFSRLVYATRVSLSIGLLGVILSFVFGIIIGGISGYYGGWIDNVIQRLIDFIRSIPTIPLWMGLAAALPVEWPPTRVYFLITLILSIIGWTGLARVVRGRFLALREEDFVTAARFVGASEARIIFRHMLPSFGSHIIAALTLAIPDMILAETSLSFLGLGLRSPVNSWGVLLQEAQNLSSVALAPWLLLPGVAVVVTILAFNFLGDGLRDAADPYGD
ncbi:MAG: ABC transporter permease [Deinococcota bacterium]